MRKTEYMYIWWSILVNWQLPYVRLSYKSNENLYLVEVYVCLAKQWNIFLTIQPAVLGYRLMSINEIVSQKIFIQKKKETFSWLGFYLLCLNWFEQFICSRFEALSTLLWMWANRPTKLIRLQNHNKIVLSFFPLRFYQSLKRLW